MDEIMEQLEIAPEVLGAAEEIQTDAAPVISDTATEGSILGKFSCVDELAKAYESLQVEFTRKSQILADMQQGKASVAVNDPIQTEVIVEKAANNKMPEIVQAKPIQSREDIIKEYLTSVAAKQQAPVVITANSDFAFGATSETRSVRDSAKIAENFFKNKEIL